MAEAQVPTEGWTPPHGTAANPVVVTPAPLPAKAPLPLPPGMSESPVATWAVSAASSAVIEAGDFGFITAGPAQRIIALIGFVGPLVVTLADALIRHGHARA